MQATSRRAGHSLFWPIMLIGLGLLWLMSSVGLLPGTDPSILFQLWPLILIAVGLDLLWGRRSPETGGIIALATLLLLLVFMWVGPALGLGGGQVVTERFTEPVDGASSAQVELNLSSAVTRVFALEDDDQLVDAEMRHAGRIDFSASGTDHRSIRLAYSSLGPGATFLGLGADLRWDIGLAPEVPIDLRVDGRSGATTLDLELLALRSLVLDAGSGATALALPATDARYLVDVSGGSGAIRVSAADQSALDLSARPGSGGMSLAFGQDADADVTLRSRSGAVSIEVPRGIEVRLEVQDRGSGRLNVPRELEQLRGDDRTGVWQSDGYEGATSSVRITVESRGSGSITLRIGR